MITMYVKSGCRYSRRVIDAVEDLKIEVTFKYKKDEGTVDEMMELGGKKQFPFMIDGDIKMYGSNEIVKYLCQKHSGDSSKYPKVESCDCED